MHLRKKKTIIKHNNEDTDRKLQLKMPFLKFKM